MDSEKEVEVGDFVMYSNGDIVSNEDGVPLRVVEIIRHPLGDICVYYIDGQFDFISDIKPAPKLLLELL
jgi:hypothetical protein